MKFWICLLIVSLTGCATATQLNTGTGRQFLIECDGTAVPVSTCYKKANQICASGWDQIGKDGATIPMAVATPEIAYAGAIERKSITVQCR